MTKAQLIKKILEAKMASDMQKESECAHCIR